MLELIDIRGALLIDNLLHVKRQLDKIRQNQISKTKKREMYPLTHHQVRRFLPQTLLWNCLHFLRGPV